MSERRPEMVSIALDQAASVDDLLSLRNWLGGEVELRGKVQLGSAAVAENELNAGVLDSILVTLAPGVPVALVTILTSWIRNRTSNVKASITKADGTSIDIDVQRAKRLTAEDVKEIAQELERLDNSDDVE